MGMGARIDWRCGVLGLLALVAGCADAPPPPSVWERHAGGVWCYRTLAEPECHAAPLPGEEGRLIASGPQVYHVWRANPAFAPETVPVSE